MENANERILLAGADPTHVSLEQRMTEVGFRIRRVDDAARMFRLLQREHFDLLILDRRLPDGNGIDLCAQLRQRGAEIPVVMLTAPEVDSERVRCLESGADDCIGKPFNSAELIARVRAILRRMRQSLGPPLQTRTVVQLGPFQLDLTHRLLKKDNIPVPLSTGDYALLSALARNAGQPMSRDHLKAMISGREHRHDDRSIDVRIARLRRLLENDASRPRYLRTVWGVGYVMVPGNV